MRYTVKQLADVAGVTPRTLHYYDEIGLLRPTIVGDNSYRYYDDAAVLRLQQIMFYRELDFSLAEIQAILDDPSFDLAHALQSHKRLLQQRLGRLSDLIHTIDRTMLSLQVGMPVETHDLFVGFDEARQAHYEAEIAEQHGEATVQASRQRWASYSPAQKARILAEGGALYRDFAALIGHDPASPAVQQLVAVWHEQIRYFYEPTPEVMAGLAEMYVTHPEFNAFYARIHPALADFLRQAILVYLAPRQDATLDLDDELSTLLGAS